MGTTELSPRPLKVTLLGASRLTNPNYLFPLSSLYSLLTNLMVLKHFSALAMDAAGEGDIIAKRDMKGKQELKKFMIRGLQALDNRLYEGFDTVFHLDNENKEKAFRKTRDITLLAPEGFWWTLTAFASELWMISKHSPFSASPRQALMLSL